MRYLGDGTVTTRDARVARDIETLGLNEMAVLVPNRRAAVQAFTDWVSDKSKTNPGSWRRETVERFLVELRTPDAGGKLRPMVGVGEYLLRRRRQQNPAR